MFLKRTLFNFSNFVLRCVDRWLASFSQLYALKNNLHFCLYLYLVVPYCIMLRCITFQSLFLCWVALSIWLLMKVCEHCFTCLLKEEFLGYIFGSGLGFYQVILRAVREIVIHVFTNFTTFLLDYSKCRLLKAYDSYCLHLLEAPVTTYYNVYSV